MTRYDVLVVGTGLAGLAAALKAAQAGLKVAALTKGNPFRSNSAMASGGINAALGSAEPDSPLLHTQDTLKGADGLGDAQMVAKLCHKAPETILELDKLGANFDRFEDGSLAQRSFGGAGKKRTCFVQDKTGAALTQALMRACNEAGVVFLTQRFLLSLLTHKKRITGISILNQKSGEVEAIGAKRVILAGGGFAGIYYGHSTNPTTTGGDILSAAFKAGLRLVNLEFVQFHPTALAGSGELVSEAVRGEGGHLVLANGERFTDELQTRDKLAREIAKRTQKGEAVYIDVRHLDPSVIETRLPTFQRAALMRQGVDVLTERVAIAPAAHYTMGGIAVDGKGRTAIKGLFACGECAYSGVHGANRLGGNSLLEAAAFGFLSAQEAAKGAKRARFGPIDNRRLEMDRALVAYHLGGENRFNPAAIRKSLGNLLMKKAGVFRQEAALLDAQEYIEYLRGLTGGLHCIDKTPGGNVELTAILELKNALEIAEAMVLAATARRESRGSHFRRDYPDQHQPLESIVEHKSGHYFQVSLLPRKGPRRWLESLRRALTN